MSVYVSTSRLHVDPERSDELVAAFRARVHLVDAFDGFLGLEVWRSPRDPSLVVMVSRWRDRASFTAYMRSEEHRISHDRIPASLQSAIHLEQLGHWESYEVEAD